MLGAFTFVLALVVIFSAHDILKLLSQDPAVSDISVRYIILMLPALFFHGQTNLMRKWLLLLEVTNVPLFSMLVTMLVHVPLSYSLVFSFEMGIEGLALASGISGVF